MPKKKKKQTRRSKSKYPALEPKYNLKSRTDLIEVDYLHKLNEEEKAWLDKFNTEYVTASFSEDDEDNLHSQLGPGYKQEVYKLNNDRNADVLTRNKTRNRLDYIEDDNVKKIGINTEDDLISEIDHKKKV